MKSTIMFILMCIALSFKTQAFVPENITDNQVTIKTFPIGIYGSNSYVVSYNKVGFIVDAGSNDPSILQYIIENNIDIKYIFCTHSHIDHTLYAMDLKALTEAKIFLGAEDLDHYKYYSKERIEEWKKSGEISDEQLMAIEKFIKIKYDSLLYGGEQFIIGDMKVEILHTPGHSKGSICLLVNGKYLFTGDLIKDNVVGNTDVDSGNEEDIVKSIEEKIFLLNNSIILFQGHGESTTLKEIRNTLFYKNK